MTDTNTALRSFRILDATGAKSVTPDTRTRFEAITGESLTFAADNPQATVLYEIASAPAGSSAAFSSNALTCDVPGVYSIRLTNGAMAPITVSIVAYRPEALNWPAIADSTQTAELRARGGSPTSQAHRRMLLGAIANGNGGRMPTDLEFASTTAAYPVPVSLDVKHFHWGRSSF